MHVFHRLIGFFFSLSRVLNCLRPNRFSSFFSIFVLHVSDYWIDFAFFHPYSQHTCCPFGLDAFELLLLISHDCPTVNGVGFCLWLLFFMFCLFWLFFFRPVMSLLFFGFSFFFSLSYITVLCFHLSCFWFCLIVIVVTVSFACLLLNAPFSFFISLLKISPLLLHLLKWH